MQLTSSKSLLRGAVDRPTVSPQAGKRIKKKAAGLMKLFYFFFFTDDLLCVLIMGFERFSLFQSLL